MSADLFVQVSAGLIVGLVIWRAKYEIRTHRAILKIEEATNGKWDRRQDAFEKRIDERLGRLEQAVLDGQSEIVRALTSEKPKPRRRPV